MTATRGMALLLEAPQASGLLVGIGPSGASAAAWKPVGLALRELGGLAELHAVRLPGRENRFREPRLRTLEAQTDDVVQHLTGLVERDPRPYHLVGVCSGAFLAFEVVRRMQHTDRRPASLVAVCQDAPWRRTEPPPSFGLDAAAFDEWLLTHTWIGSTLADDPEARSLFEPVLRADCEAVQTYRYSAEGGELTVPVVSIIAEEDVYVSPERAATWASGAPAGWTPVTVPGDHHLLMSAPRTLASALHGLLDR